MYVLSRNMKKYQNFLSDFFFLFLVVKFSVYFNRHVFVMGTNIGLTVCIV